MTSDKKIQLFILPYAGGSIASFKRVVDLLDPVIDVVTVEYSGRGTRLKEPLAGSLKEMQEDALEYCLKRRDISLPFAVFGYSMGSLLGYEILINKGIPGKLVHFFVAAEVAPQTRALELRKEPNPTEERVIERAIGLGGLDKRMLSNKRFKDIYVKPMISDFRHFFEYQFNDYGTTINTDATFLYCEKDTALESVQEWEQLIEGTYDYYEMGDNHFFINQHFEQIAKIINSKLAQL